jgi:hypothetical protein
MNCLGDEVAVTRCRCCLLSPCHQSNAARRKGTTAHRVGCDSCRRSRVKRSQERAERCSLAW